MTLERSLLKRIVEAALFAAGQPLSLEKLGELFYEEERPSLDDFRAVLAELESDYAERGVQLKEVASGYRFQASQETGEWVSRLWEEKPQRYSRALLETLALIAYRQPITRGEVEDIRGVSVSSHIIKTLLEREWVRVLGYRDVPGRPAMYGTTKAFLDYFNLRSLDELPTLAEVRDLDKISAELDERLQQTQPQASLPLETAPAAVEAAAEPASTGPSEAPIVQPDPLSPEASLPAEQSGQAVPAESSQAEPAHTESAHRESLQKESFQKAPAAEPSAAAETPTSDAAPSETAPPSLFSSVLQKARSLFADPSPTAPSSVPSSPAPDASENGELPPSPIDPHDPRLN